MVTTCGDASIEAGRRVCSPAVQQAVGASGIALDVGGDVKTLRVALA